jgi:hypothetical protein
MKSFREGFGLSLRLKSVIEYRLYSSLSPRLVEEFLAENIKFVNRLLRIFLSFTKVQQRQKGFRFLHIVCSLYSKE